MTFLKNKYTALYYKIVDRAKTRLKLEGYIERHHIIPKCAGGSNKNDNLAGVSFREHWILHHLLLKMVDDKRLKSKMYYAFCRMHNGGNGQKINSRAYERIKRANRHLCSGENNPRFGMHNSEKHKSILSAFMKGNQYSLGLKRSDETKQKMAKALIGNKNNLGNKRSTKTKDKMSESISRRLSRIHTFVDPDNHKIEVLNLRHFCIAQGLNDGHMFSVSSGKRKQHKGWRKWTPNLTSVSSVG